MISRKRFNQFQPDYRRILIVLLVAILLITSVFTVLYLYKFGGNITGFFRIGSVLPLSPYLQGQSVFIHQGKVGNDGQQFLSLAFDPLLRNPDTIHSLNHPLYRARRILYPLLGYLLGCGNPRLIPYALVLINGLAITLLVWVTGLWFRHYQKPIWRSLLILCIPSVWIVFSISTADLLSNLLLVITIFCYATNRPLATVIAIGCACLARETMVLLWLAIVIASILERHWRQLVYLPLALIPIALWQGYLSFHVSSVSDHSLTNNLGYPLIGISSKLYALIKGGIHPQNLVDIYFFFLMIAAFITVIFTAKYIRNPAKPLVLMATLEFMLFSFAKMQILGHFVDYTRVFSDVYYLLVLSAVFPPIRFKTGLIALAGLASIAYLFAFTLEFSSV